MGKGANVGFLPSCKLGALCSAQEILRNSCASAFGGTLGRAGALQAFASEQDNGAIGLLHRAMRAIGPSAQESADAVAALQAVNPQNRPEQTLKEVLHILLTDGTDHLTDGSAATLRDVAQRCPIDDGFGVYIARSALLKLDTLPKYYVSDCERMPSMEEISEKHKLEDGNGFLVYPNPSQGMFTVEYELEAEETGVLTIYGIAGNRLLSRALRAEESRADIDLGAIAGGLYLLSIEVNGQRKLSQRISVIRP